jgi:hypothetical protein
MGTIQGCMREEDSHSGGRLVESVGLLWFGLGVLLLLA